MNNYCFKKIERCIEYNLYKEGEKCDYSGDNYEFNGSCVKCPNGYILDELGIMCQKECPLGKILSYGECIDEIDNCDTYAQSKKCSKCYDYHELKEDGTCSSCPFEKVGNGLKCFDRIEGCSEQNGGICEKCANYDEVLNEERNQCIQKDLIENCMIQINDKCSICMMGINPAKIKNHVNNSSLEKMKILNLVYLQIVYLEVFHILNIKSQFLYVMLVLQVIFIYNF